MVSIFLLEDPICRNLLGLVALGIKLGIRNDHLIPERAFLCNKVSDLGLSYDHSFLAQLQVSWLAQAFQVII